MPGFDVKRLVYDVVNIIPHDISPEDLLKLVKELNRELNSKALQRDKKLKKYYDLIKGKNIQDRKYQVEKSKLIVDGMSHGSVVPK